MKPLTKRELNMVVGAIDLWSKAVNQVGFDVPLYTCYALDNADQRDRVIPRSSGFFRISPLRYRYAEFFDQDDQGFWPLSAWSDTRREERAMLLATFLMLKGVVPGEES